MNTKSWDWPPYGNLSDSDHSFENAVEMRPDESIRDQPAFAGAAAIERRNGSGAAHYYHWVMNGSIDFICLDTRWATVSMTLNSPPSWNSGEGFKVRLDQDGRRGHARGASGKQKYELQHVRLSRRDSKRARSIRSPLASYSNQARRCMFWPAIHISSWMTYSGHPTGATMCSRAGSWALPSRSLPIASSIPPSRVARTDVYGYLLASVFAEASVTFSFKELDLTTCGWLTPKGTPIRWFAGSLVLPGERRSAYTRSKKLRTIARARVRAIRATLLDCTLIHSVETESATG
jgi:hypothetical protein